MSTGTLLTSAPPTAKRISSWWWDYLVILAWLLLVFIVVGLPQILGWWDLAVVWTEQTSADIVITLLTVVPYFFYLVITESGPLHATFGKRRSGIEVVAKDGDEAETGSVVIRNLIKVLPWQLGHMGTMRLVTSVEPPPLALWFEFASLALFASIVLPALFRRSGLHDLVAGTRVTRRGQSDVSKFSK